MSAMQVSNIQNSSQSLIPSEIGNLNAANEANNANLENGSVSKGTSQLALPNGVQDFFATKAKSTSTEDTIVTVLTTIASVLTQLKSIATAVAELSKIVADLTKSDTPAKNTADTPSGSTTNPTNTTPTISYAEKEKALLKPASNGRVSEMELRRGIVAYQLFQKDQKLLDAFQSAYASSQASGETPTGAVKAGLQNLVNNGNLEKADANWLYSLATRAAQFEGSDLALSTSTTDGHGMELNAAVKLSEATLAGIQAGQIEVKSLSI